MRTVVYIDGFNLYYSLLRRTSLKWLDIVALFRDHALGSNSQVVQVRYYTALVLARIGAPDISRVQVYDFNEKKTDVSLASDLLAGAQTDAFDQAVICSNDTDLEPALATLRRYHPHLRLGVVAPVKSSDNRHIAADLKEHVDWSKTLSTVHIANAQLPERIPASSLCRPEAWK